MMILCQCFLKPDVLEVHLVFINEALVTELWRYNPFKSDVFKMLSYTVRLESRCALRLRYVIWLSVSKLPLKCTATFRTHCSSKTSYHLATKYGVKEMSGFWIGL